MQVPARRRFLVIGAAWLPVAGVHPFARAASASEAAPAAHAAHAPPASPRVLRFAHLHTGERLSVEYFAAGGYLPDALAAVNRLLRDFRTGDVGVIDPALLDQLHALRAATGSSAPFEIISGFRSGATNEALRARSESSGVARRSLHLEGRAIDIRLADVPLAGLRDAALSLRQGGVGFYPASNFVHIDTGRVRAW
jgi:uncharacterized protein YcbK (DUF882 family)